MRDAKYVKGWIRHLHVSRITLPSRSTTNATGVFCYDGCCDAEGAVDRRRAGGGGGRRVAGGAGGPARPPGGGAERSVAVPGDLRVQDALQGAAAEAGGASAAEVVGRVAQQLPDDGR